MASDKQDLETIGQEYCNLICKREFRNQRFKLNERPIEYAYVFQWLMRPCPETVLDVGTGTTALPSLIQKCGFVVTAIDNVKDYWPKGVFNRHFHIIGDDITQTGLKTTFDFITCVSVLEHIPPHEEAVSAMLRLLNRGGHLLMTFPYNELDYIPNAYKLADAGYGQKATYVCQVFSRNEIDRWLAKSSAELLHQEYWRVFEGRYWTCGRRLTPPRLVNKNDEHHLSCILIKRG